MLKIANHTYVLIFVVLLSGCADMTAKDWATVGVQATVGAFTYAALGTNFNDLSWPNSDFFVAGAAMDAAGELIDIADENSENHKKENKQRNDEASGQGGDDKPTRNLQQENKESPSKEIGVGSTWSLNASDKLDAGMSVLTRYNVKLLSDKSFNSSVVADIPAAISITIIEDYEDWVSVRYREHEGYLAKRWLTKIDTAEKIDTISDNDKQKTITTRYAVKLYSQPTFSSDVIELLPAHQELHVIERMDLFVKVSHKEIIGYVDHRWSW